MKKHVHQHLVKGEQVSKYNYKDQKEELAFFNQCPKFGDSERHREVFCDRAIAFLKLRSKECDKHKALVFTKRKLCKFDVTQNKDGPAACRLLKPQKGEKVAINGWLNPGHEMKYDMGPEFESDYRKLMLEDEEDKIIADYFAKKEENLKGDYKGQIKTLNAFVRDLNKRYNFSPKQGYELLHAKLRESKKQFRKSRDQPVKLMKFKGMNFMHILPFVDGMQDEVDLKPKTPIQTLSAFRPLFKSEEQIQIKEAFPDDIFSHLQDDENPNEDDQRYNQEDDQRFSRNWSKLSKVNRFTSQSKPKKSLVFLSPPLDDEQKQGLTKIQEKINESNDDGVVQKIMEGNKHDFVIENSNTESNSNTGRNKYSDQDDAIIISQFELNKLRDRELKLEQQQRESDFQLGLNMIKQKAVANINQRDKLHRVNSENLLYQQKELENIKQKELDYILRKPQTTLQKERQHKHFQTATNRTPNLKQNKPLQKQLSIQTSIKKEFRRNTSGENLKFSLTPNSTFYPTQHL